MRKPAFRRSGAILAAVLGVSMLPRPGLAAALVPKLAEPVSVDLKCDRAKEKDCPASGVRHYLLPRPIGGQCPSIAVPEGVSRRTAAVKPVLLKVYANGAGDVAWTLLSESSGDWRLDDAAVDAARECRFHMGAVDGQPAKTIVKLRYTWEPNAQPDDPAEQISARALRPSPPLRLQFGPQPEDLECGEASVAVPPNVLADPDFQVAVVRVALRISPPAFVSTTHVFKPSGFPELDDAVAATYRGMPCTIDTPLRKSIWILREQELKR